MEPRVSDRLPRFLGEYEVVRLIARGGMGAVFEVRAPRTGAPFAAKIVLRGADPHARARFRREAELIARCDRHPGIVKVHAVGESDGDGLFVILDLVPGEGLHALLARVGKLTPERAATLARDLALALGFIHAQGVVHRDVKPSNVLLDSAAGGAPRITDFGLATAQDVEKLTKTGHFVGTVDYCAPEQVAGKPCGPEADVFSLGCLLFCALSGEPPFQGPDLLSTIARIVSDKPAPDLRAVADEVPGPLADIVRRALEKDPSRRYANGAELALELTRFLSGEPVLATSPSQVRVWKGVLGGLVLASAMLLAGALAALGRQREAAGSSLALGRDALAQATRSLALAREGAFVTSASEAALADALSAGVLARERLDDARRRGSAEADEPARAVGSLLVEVGLVAAERELSSGRPAAALARLETTHATSPDARLLHARALLALGRVAEAKTEADLVLAQAGEKNPDQLERGADVLLGTGEAARAAAVYTRALESGTRRWVEVRAKRGGAAARAGDERLALEDLRALIPTVTALPASRAANEKLVPLAPVLYRRGLAARANDDAGGRDLDAAWQIANPPPELADLVGERWVNEVEVARVQTTLRSTLAPSAEVVSVLVQAVEHDRRAALIAPAATFEARAANMSNLRAWYDNQADFKARRTVMNQLLAISPEEPLLLYLCARSCLDTGNDATGALALLYKAMDAVPDSRSAGIESLARDMAVFAFQSGVSEGAPLDLERLVRLVRIAHNYEAWYLLAQAAMTLGDHALARRALEAAATTENASQPENAGSLEALWGTLIQKLPDLDEAVTLARARDDKIHTSRSLENVAAALARAKRWDDAADVVLARPDASKASLDLARTCLEAAGRTAEATELRARIEAGRARVPPR